MCICSGMASPKSTYFKRYQVDRVFYHFAKKEQERRQLAKRHKTKSELAMEQTHVDVNVALTAHDIDGRAQFWQVAKVFAYTLPFWAYRKDRSRQLMSVIRCPKHCIKEGGGLGLRLGRAVLREEARSLAVRCRLTRVWELRVSSTKSEIAALSLGRCTSAAAYWWLRVSCQCLSWCTAALAQVTVVSPRPFFFYTPLLVGSTTGVVSPGQGPRQITASTGKLASKRTDARSPNTPRNLETPACFHTIEKAGDPRDPAKTFEALWLESRMIWYSSGLYCLEYPDNHRR